MPGHGGIDIGGSERLGNIPALQLGLVIRQTFLERRPQFARLWLRGLRSPLGGPADPAVIVRHRPRKQHGAGFLHVLDKVESQETRHEHPVVRMHVCHVRAQVLGPGGQHRGRQGAQGCQAEAAAR